jgi:hypothetical protein
VDPLAAELVDIGRIEEYTTLETDALAGNFLVLGRERMRRQSLSIAVN